MKALGRLLLFVVLLGGLGFGVWWLWPKAPGLELDQALVLIQNHADKQQPEEVRKILTQLTPQGTWLANQWKKLLRALTRFGQKYDSFGELEQWTQKAAEANFLNSSDFLPFRVYALYKLGRVTEAKDLADQFNLDEGAFPHLKKLLDLESRLGKNTPISADLIRQELFGKNPLVFPEVYSLIYALSQDMAAGKNAVVLYLRDGRYEEISRFIQTLPGFAQDQYFWAQVYWALGRIFEARDLVRSFNQGPEATEDSLLLHGYLEAILGQEKNAQDIFAKMRQDPRPDWRSYYIPGLLNLLRGEAQWQSLESHEKVPEDLRELWKETLTLVTRGRDLSENDVQAFGPLSLLANHLYFRLNGTPSPWASLLEDQGYLAGAPEPRRNLAEALECQRYFLEPGMYPSSLVIPRLKELFSRTWTEEFFQRKGAQPHQAVAEALLWQYVAQPDLEKAQQLIQRVVTVGKKKTALGEGALETGLKSWLPIYQGLVWALKGQYPQALEVWNRIGGSAGVSKPYNLGLVRLKLAGMASSDPRVESQHALREFNQALSLLPGISEIWVQRLRSQILTSRAQAKVQLMPPNAGQATYAQDLSAWKADLERDLALAVALDSTNHEAFLLLKNYLGTAASPGGETHDQIEKPGPDRKDPGVLPAVKSDVQSPGTSGAGGDHHP